MRVTINKDYKCIRNYGSFKELEVWKVIDIQGMIMLLQRGGTASHIDLRAFQVVFENIKK